MSYSIKRNFLIYRLAFGGIFGISKFWTCHTWGSCSKIKEILLWSQTPKHCKRAEDLTLAQSENYHKNSSKSMRSAINRHLQDLGSSIDIVRDMEFKSAKNTMDRMLKTMTKTGASRATNYKAVFHAEDLEQISSYFRTESHSPIFFGNVCGTTCRLISLHVV